MFIFVSQSRSAGGNGYTQLEKGIINILVSKKIKIVTAAGNENKQLSTKSCLHYPACYKLDFPSIYIVENLDNTTTNYGFGIDTEKENGNNVGNPPMSGSSQAAAIFTGKLFSK